MSGLESTIAPEQGGTNAAHDHAHDHCCASHANVHSIRRGGGEGDHGHDDCCHAHGHAHPRNEGAGDHRHGQAHGRGHEALNFACCETHDDDGQGAAGHVHGAARDAWWPLALAGVIAIGAEATGWVGGPGWLSLLLAVAAIGLSGVGVYRRGLASLFRADLNINALMSIAVTGAVLLGHWPEAAMVMVLFAIAETLEEKSLDRARNAIARLMDVAPQTVFMSDGQGGWIETAASLVTPGARLRVRPGERIGLDGIVIAGRSAVDQAPITGESIPVDKQASDPVYAGTINGMAEMQYRVTAAFQDTTLARIINAVQEAQASKAPMQRFVDRFARVYTPIVCLVALAIAVLPPLLLAGATWGDWVYKALVLLVIACPCALVISTPVAVVSGLAAAARHGILIKGGIYLEQGRKLRWVILDKTGTLTTGRPSLTDVVPLDAAADTEHTRSIALSLGKRSDHPVSLAIASLQVDETVLTIREQNVEGFQAIQGAGVQGRINGVAYSLGSPRWLSAALDDAGRRAVQTLQARGRSVAVLAADGTAKALFGVADYARPSSREAVNMLHRLGLRTVMASGDNTAVAREIASEVGIDEIHAELLPEDKLAVLKRYAANGAVGMVGDGINDAPALARADIGFAMGAMGTDTAIETADVALMDDDLGKIPKFIQLSRATHAVLMQNISAALGIKLFFLALALVGLGTMWMAVFADVGASLLVVANSLRLLRK
ncbi:heavy metal translocating P-type ATPase [Allopusillimonas ginsengisoli]|uniref:heavy metal translocating P-type ATPase n=1 Tax=Allopusillimonas ginsengisoli TaxID=453575 RepID=UPI0010221155|nr:heavy metal translocating P-type ATPase [Allopusillimonas ginsengisoli]TEA79447.1 heavy metal translocating P-type ATPase [Allopusillimonas ginsengisoli]